MILYYGYLPATFIYHDITMSFLGKKKLPSNTKLWAKETYDGKRVIKMSSGLAILYMPFFLAANALADVFDYPKDGFNQYYKLALVMSSLFYLIIGLAFLRKLMLRYFSQIVTALTILTLVFSTNLLWYVTFEAPMSHAYNFSLISIFLLLIDNWYKRANWKGAILIGLLSGLIVLIRPTNILIALLFIFWNIESWQSLLERFGLLLKHYGKILVILLLAFVVWIPQLLYWKEVTGQYLYYSYTDQGFFFNNPHMFSMIFSWNKSLIIYSPIFVFSIAGFILLYKNNKGLFWPMVIFFIPWWYVIASWWDWMYGGSFGQRVFIDSYSIFAFSMAASLTWVLKKKPVIKITFSIIFLSLFILGQHHFWRFYGGSIHWSDMTKEAYFDSFWSTRPSKTFKSKLRKYNTELMLQGIYKYEDEINKDKKDNKKDK